LPIPEPRRETRSDFNGFSTPRLANLLIANANRRRKSALALPSHGSAGLEYGVGELARGRRQNDANGA
jgi:hypothetical protein